jgi:TolB-like protein
MEWVILGMAVLAAAPGASASSIAVHPFTTHGTAPEAVQQLDAAVRIELSRLGLRVVPDEQVRQSLGSPCADQPRCAARLGRAVGADEVLLGEVRELPDSFAVTLRLVDVAAGTQSAQVSASINRDVEDMVRATRAQVVRLKAPERHVGRLVVVTPAGWAARLDGQALRKHDLVLRPGTYEVELTRTGQEVADWLEVRFEQTTSVSLAASHQALAVTYSPWPQPIALPLPRPAPGPGSPTTPSLEPAGAPWPKWPGYVAAGLGAALVAGGVGLHLGAGSLGRDLEALRGPGGAYPRERHAELRAGLDRRDALRSGGRLLIATGIATAAGGATYLLVLPAPEGAGASIAMAGAF